MTGNPVCLSSFITALSEKGYSCSHLSLLISHAPLPPGLPSATCFVPHPLFLLATNQGTLELSPGSTLFLSHLPLKAKASDNAGLCLEL